MRELPPAWYKQDAHKLQISMQILLSGILITGIPLRAIFCRLNQVESDKLLAEKYFRNEFTVIITATIG